MGKRLVFGPTHVAVQDEELSKGYQEGHTLFTHRYHGTVLTEQAIYDLLANQVCSVQSSDRHRAGFVLGWCAAFHGQGRAAPMVGYYSDDAQGEHPQ
jgi:hypothetical protein